MKWCPHGSPALPTLEESTLHKGVETRFSLKGKNALGKYTMLHRDYAKYLMLCVVTGGARGLGLTIGHGFLEHGLSKLALFDLDEDVGSKAAADLCSMFPHAGVDFRRVDVTDAVALTAAVEEIAETFNGIHVLATFAGIVNSVSATEYTPEGFRKIVDVNTIGTFLTAQVVGK